MKKIFQGIVFLAFASTVYVIGFMIGQVYASQAPTIPVKLFDVRNGNRVVDNGTTYPQAIVIPFKDKAAKDKLIDAFAKAYNYQDTIPGENGTTIPNPQSKTVFANRQITRYLKDILESAEVNAASDAARKTASDALKTELPDSN